MISPQDRTAGRSAPPGAAPGLSTAAMLRTSGSRHGGGTGAWLFLLTIVTAGALAHVGVRLKSLEVAYDLGRERRIATDLEEQRRRLQIEIGMLKDPRRVIALARTKLNMGPPAPEAIRRLGSGTSLGDSASRATTTTNNANANANAKVKVNTNTNTNADANTSAGSGPRAPRPRRGPR